MKRPEFILLEKQLNVNSECELCGRGIKHSYVVKNTIENKTFRVGAGCARKLSGQTIKQLYANKVMTETIERNEDREANAKSRVIEFKEANPEMMDFIEAGADKSTFLFDMKTSIENYGTLTPAQFASVYSMMLKPADLSCKVTQLPVTLIRAKSDYNHFTGGYSVTLFCESEEHELVRVFFSSISEGLNEFMIKNNIISTSGELNKNIMENNVKFNVSGSFDGYKIKRAKIG